MADRINNEQQNEILEALAEAAEQAGLSLEMLHTISVRSLIVQAAFSSVLEKWTKSSIPGGADPMEHKELWVTKADIALEVAKHFQFQLPMSDINQRIEQHIEGTIEDQLMVNDGELYHPTPMGVSIAMLRSLGMDPAPSGSMN